jgi:RNA polymerase sigma factor (sigma-70 family)
MRQIKNQRLSELLKELRFTPKRQRQKQLDNAEKLLSLVDKSREYSFEFVCFRITGFRPKSFAAQELIKGEELADDLQIFISKLSGQIGEAAGDQGQKVYTIEEFAARLGVSTKTINRWRKRGLVARKFVFGDGKKRLGFLQSGVDKFFSLCPETVKKAERFSRLAGKEKQQIIKRAMSLAAKTAMSRHQIIRQIAAETGRSHETIRYTILNYEKDHPGKVIFKRPGGVISPSAAEEIYKLFRQGCKVEELMSRFSRSKSSIYRLINQRKAKTFLTRKIEYIPSEEFSGEGAEGSILAKPIKVKKPVSSGGPDLFESAGGSLPEYLRILRNIPVLNREQELELFRRYNFLKYLACVEKKALRPSQVSGRRLKKIEDYLAEAESIKRAIIEANLRLVVSIARKHTTSGVGFQDLVGEGHVSLMRAVEKFDYTKGFRFGTYAAWAIAKDYARKIPAETARPDKAPTAALTDIQRDFRAVSSAGVVSIERARQSLIQTIRENLNEREQYIILNHFGLLGSSIKKNVKTLKQIGDELGLTKERVRQIELIALQKLKHSLSIEEFELLTG